MTKLVIPSRRAPKVARVMSLTVALAAGLWIADTGLADTLANHPASVGKVEGTRRVVAIGDIHGAFNGVRTILREVGLIDDKDRWTGGDTVLVQTGDFLDRGPGATKVAELLMSLQEQAPAGGGEVVVLLGNHEVLNLIGDLRDVTKYILRNLIDAHSEKRLTVSCNDYASFHRRLAKLQNEKPPRRAELLEECFASQQLGLVEYLEAIGPEGKIGRWIRELPAAHQIGDVVFLHGGISPTYAGHSLDELNRGVRQEIEFFDQARAYLIDQGLILPTSGLRDILGMARWLNRNAPDGYRGDAPLPEAIRELIKIDEWLLIREDGPLWFRGYARWTEDAEAESKLTSILGPLDARHVVVAHTPQLTMSITPRFDAGDESGPKVFLIDTGMLTSVYKGRPSALEIDGESFTAVYVSQRKVLHGPAGDPATGTPAVEEPAAPALAGD